MTSSRRTSAPASIIENGVIPVATLAFLRSRTKNRLYDFILRRFMEKEESEGLTKAELARRIGKKPEVITRLLGAPGNWGIETVTELLAGISQEELQPESISLNRAASNYRYQPWITELAPRARLASRRPVSPQGNAAVIKDSAFTITAVTPSASNAVTKLMELES